MFGNQGSDQGCGKWLTTKNTRRIAQSLKQKNARGTRKGRKKQSVIKTDHLPGVVTSISSTPMSPRLIEMLSRVKQAKVERFFKPAGSKDQENKKSESEERNDDGLGKKDVLQSYTTPISKRRHKMTTDQDELQLWGDDGITSSERLQNETDKLNISGVLPIEVSKPCSSADDDLHGLHQFNTTTTNQYEPFINSSQDDVIKSPVSKKLKSMTAESPTCPLSLFPSSFNNDDEKDSDSFHYTQWVDEQKRKSKELQDNSPGISEKGTELWANSGGSSLSGSSNLNKKYDQDIFDEINSDTESQFRFSQWALEQKSKCKKLQNDSHDEVLSEPRSKDWTVSLSKKFKQCKSSNHLQSDMNWTESNFQYTEWVKEQRTKSKEIQNLLPESKELRQTCHRIRNESLDENDVCIPESEVFEGVELGSQCGWEYEKNDYKEDKSENARNRDHLKNSNMNPFSREALIDVPNEVMCDNGACSKTERKHLRELYQKDIENEESYMTSPTQESEYFWYTEWTKNQRQICKQIQKDPELPSFQHDF
ncbi:uncharacterized protein LOC116291814 [Actinia tenebrosa]|uniref:Uncharacterized protein LOC116291814 n=1 Tax=Actinia tenebrosa TaxID=6105 RepID=A0A6P8HEN8_ACTTE|nr:uncharacterized protein LOC116291814 [Actinia tenebrosa]